MNNLWIRITFNSNNYLKEKESFVSELKKVCPVQVREEWYPSACTCFEFYVELFINSPLGVFIKEIVIPGMAFEMTKSAFFSISNSLKAFLDKNEEFNLEYLQLSFDDITIKINDVISYGFLLRFSKSLPHHLEVLKSLDVTEISMIELPFIQSNDYNEDYDYPLLSPTDEDSEEEYIWKITYLYGCDHCYYSPYHEKLVDI